MKHMFAHFFLVLMVFLLVVGGTGYATALTVEDVVTDGFLGSPGFAGAAATFDVSQFRKDLAHGNLGILTQRLNLLSPEERRQPDALAIESILLAAEGQPNPARRVLADAEKRTASKDLVLYAQSMLLRMANDYAAAEKIVRQAIDLNPSHPFPWNILGRIQFDQGDFAAAIGSFNKTISLNDQFFSAYLNAGAAYIQVGQPLEAQQNFAKALRLNPQDPQAHLGLTSAYENLGRNHQAVESFQRYIQLTDSTAENLRYLARLQNGALDYQGLLKTGEALQSLDENHGLLLQVRALLYLGRLNSADQKLQKITVKTAERDYYQALYHLLSHNYSAAAAQISNALETDPDNDVFLLTERVLALTLEEPSKPSSAVLTTNNSPVMMYYQGLESMMKQDFNSALSQMQQADNLIAGFSMSGMTVDSLKGSVSNKDVKPIALGTYYYLINMYPAAKNAFQSVSNPKSFLPNYWLGQISLMQRQRDQAVTFFQKAILDAEFFPALYTLGDLSYLAGNLDEAEKYYLRALQQKSDKGLLIKLGLLYEQKENHQQVVSIYRRLIDDNPNLHIGYNQLAWYYTRNNMNLDEALALASDADKLMPGNSAVLDTIGWIHYQRGDYNKALDYVERANRIVSGNPTILYHLGAVHKALGNNEAARAYLLQATEISNKFDEYGEVRRMLDEL